MSNMTTIPFSIKISAGVLKYKYRDMSKTNKLVEYGLKAAEVGVMLAEPKLTIPTASSNTRSKLMSMGTFYAPTKARPETLYFTYCAAIIDVILDLYRGASYYPYEQIKMQWGTPGCQSVIKPFRDVVSKSKNASQYFIALSQLTGSIDNPDNKDWENLMYYISDWIKRFCNRQSDLKRGKVNIQAKTSKYLTLVLVFRSLGDYLKLNFDDLNIYRGEAKDIMEQRKHSRRRDKQVQAFKKAGLEFKYGGNIRETARLWVRVRIFRAHNITIDEFASDMRISKRNLLDRIDPFDKAMDYDKHPG